MKRKPMIHPLPWWERPLRCLLGNHSLRTHPDSPWWQYCQKCGGERNNLP